MDDEKKLPTQIIQLNELRIDRNAGKPCRCDQIKRVLNPESRQVYCEQCGALIDPFDALVDITKWLQGENKKLQKLHEQAKELASYKPWLKIIKYLESRYRGKKVLPNCPRCHEPFHLEELTSWSGREYAERRIQKYVDEKKQN